MCPKLSTAGGQRTAESATNEAKLKLRSVRASGFFRLVCPVDHFPGVSSHFSIGIFSRAFVIESQHLPECRSHCFGRVAIALRRLSFPDARLKGCLFRRGTTATGTAASAESDTARIRASQVSPITRLVSSPKRSPTRPPTEPPSPESPPR